MHRQSNPLFHAFMAMLRKNPKRWDHWSKKSDIPHTGTYYSAGGAFGNQGSTGGSSGVTSGGGYGVGGYGQGGYGQ